MHIYRCELTLLEATFFSSREVSATYQTEPLIAYYTERKLIVNIDAALDADSVYLNVCKILKLE